jgi:hypothetical protein
MWGENFGKMFCKYFSFSLSLFAHGPKGVEYLRIGGYVLGFLLFFEGFQIQLSSFLRLETYFSKDSFRIFWSLYLSLLFFLLYIALLSAV